MNKTVSLLQTILLSVEFTEGTYYLKHQKGFIQHEVGICSISNMCKTSKVLEEPVHRFNFHLFYFVSFNPLQL